MKCISVFVCRYRLKRMSQFLNILHAYTVMVASFPGSRVGRKREPSTDCLHMRLIIVMSSIVDRNAHYVMIVLVVGL